MKNLIIIAVGGMGRTLYDMSRESMGYGDEFVIKGFIDDNLQALDGFANYPPVLDKISTYIPQENDVFVCSIGGAVRKKCMEELINRGAQFINLIHRTARIGTNVQLGVGNIVGAYTCIGADAKIGSYNLIQSYTVIGHDVRMGDWNRIDNEADIYTSSVLNHGVVVEDRAHVGACSFVIRRVKEGTTVIGNPAKKLM